MQYFLIAFIYFVECEKYIFILLIFVGSDIQYLLRHRDAAQTRAAFTSFHLKAFVSSMLLHQQLEEEEGECEVFLVVLESICKQHAAAA